MIGFLFAWLLVIGLSLLLVTKTLRNPELTESQRRQANILTMVAVLMQFVLSIWALGSGLWSPIFDTPPITSLAQFDALHSSWGRFQGKISEKSELANEERGYAAYVEYDSSLRGAGVQFYRGRGTIIELSDGTLIEAPELEYANLYARSWETEDNFAYLKPGDTVVFKGHVMRIGEPDERGVTHRLSGLEFLYSGDDAAYGESATRKEGVIAGYIYLVLAGVTILVVLASLLALVRSLLLARRERLAKLAKGD